MISRAEATIFIGYMYAKSSIRI